MIKEIKTLQDLEKASQDWVEASTSNHVKNISNPSVGEFNKDSVSFFIASMLKKSIEEEDILPYIKIWSFEEGGQSLAGACYVAKKDPLTNLKQFEEFMWQCKGKLAGTLKEKKMMLFLLRHAEAYAKQSGLDTLILSRDPRFHKVNKNNSLEISNNYTRNNFSVAQITYSKKLK
tara:strand:+ start:286 stop:810 length:525 start_codon:yes stop_codon:yes gene_type:complete